MSDNYQPNSKDESLEILYAIDKTSTLVQENKRLKYVVKKQRLQNDKLEKTNIQLIDENNNVAVFKSERHKHKLALKNSKSKIETLQKRKDNLNLENRKLKRDLTNLDSKFNNYKKEIHAQYKSIRIKSKLIRYVSLIICVSVFSWFMFLIAEDNRDREIASLNENIEFLTVKNGTVRAKVIGLYSAQGIRILQYQNDKGQIWEVEDYQSITDDNLKIDDRIFVDFSIKDDVVIFKNIQKLNNRF